MNNDPIINAMYAALAIAVGGWVVFGIATHLWKNSDKRYTIKSAEEFKKFTAHMKQLQTEQLTNELLGQFTSINELSQANKRLDKCLKKQKQQSS